MMAVKPLARGKKQSVPMVTLDKHVGEMDIDETEECLVDPENRIIKQVTVSDVELANKLFDDLMGTSVVNRKAYVLEHAQEAEYGI